MSDLYNFQPSKRRFLHKHRVKAENGRKIKKDVITGMGMKYNLNMVRYSLRHPIKRRYIYHDRRIKKIASLNDYPKKDQMKYRENQNITFIREHLNYINIINKYSESYANILSKYSSFKYDLNFKGYSYHGYSSKKGLFYSPRYHYSSTSPNPKHRTRKWYPSQSTQNPVESLIFSLDL